MSERWMQRVGLGAVIIVALFLAMDAGLKLAGAEVAIKATGPLGFSATATRMLGALLAAATLAYVIPATRVLGAIILTGYLGGAVAIHAARGSSLGSHVLFGVYLGLLVWGGAWLCDPSLRGLIPLRRRDR